MISRAKTSGHKRPSTSLRHSGPEDVPVLHSSSATIGESSYFLLLPPADDGGEGGALRRDDGCLESHARAAAQGTALGEVMGGGRRERWEVVAFIAFISRSTRRAAEPGRTVALGRRRREGPGGAFALDS